MNTFFITTFNSRLYKEYAHNFIVPIGSQIIRFSFPIINPRPLQYPYIRVSSDSDTAKTYNFANMNAIARPVYK